MQEKYTKKQEKTENKFLFNPSIADFIPTSEIPANILPY